MLNKKMINLYLENEDILLPVFSSNAILSCLLSIDKIKRVYSLRERALSKPSVFYEHSDNLSALISSINYDDFFSMGDYLSSYQNFRESDKFSQASFGFIEYKVNVIMPTSHNYILNFRVLQIIFIKKFFEILHHNLELLIKTNREEFFNKNTNLFKFYEKLDFILNFETENSPFFVERFMVQTGAKFLHVEHMPRLSDDSKQVFVENRYIPPAEYNLFEIINQLILNPESLVYKYPFPFNLLDHGELKSEDKSLLKKKTLIYVEDLYKMPFKDLNIFLDKFENIFNPLIDDFITLLQDDNSYVDVSNKALALDIASKMLKFKLPCFFKIQHYLEYCNANLGLNLSRKVFHVLSYLNFLINRTLKKFYVELEKDSKFLDVINLKTIKKQPATFFVSPDTTMREIGLQYTGDFVLPCLHDLNLNDLTLYISDWTLYSKLKTLDHLINFFYNFLKRDALLKLLSEPLYQKPDDITIKELESLWLAYIKGKRYLEESEYYEVIKRLYEE